MQVERQDPKPAETAPPVGWARAWLASGFLRQVGGTFAARVAVMGMGIVGSIIVARGLGPAGRGLCAEADALGWLIVQFLLLGLHNAGTYLIAQDRRRLAGLVGNALLCSLGVGGAAALLGWLACQAWPGLMTLPPLLLLLAWCSVPLRFLSLLLYGLLMGLQQVRAANAADMSSGLLVLVLMIAIFAAGWGTPETAFGAAQVGTVAVDLLMLALLWPSLERRPRPELPLMRQMLGYGVRAHLSPMAVFLVPRLDVLMIARLVEGDDGARATGLYSVASSLGDLLLLFPTVVGLILLPRLTAMPTPEARWRAMRGVLAGVFALSSLAVAALAVLAGPLIGFFFGLDFAPAAGGFLYLAPGIVLLSLSMVLMHYFASQGMPAVMVWAPVGMIAVKVAANALAIPPYGFIGAAATSSLAYALMLGLCLACYVRKPSRGDV